MATACTKCSGAGQITCACTKCNGAGQIARVVKGKLWFSKTMLDTCGACGGKGTASGACSACDGKGTALAQVLKTLDTYSASSAQKEWAHRELLALGGGAVNPILDFIEAGHKLFGEVELLAEIGSPAVEPILARLGSCHSYVFMRAAQALGKIRDPRAVPVLIAELRGADKGHRHCATDALGEIGDPQAVNALIDAMAIGDTDDDTSSRAAMALGEIGDKRAQPALLAAFRKGQFMRSSGNVRPDEHIHEVMVPAAYSLAMLGVPEVKDAIQKMIGNAGDAYSLPYVTADMAKELQLALNHLQCLPFIHANGCIVHCRSRADAERDFNTMLGLLKDNRGFSYDVGILEVNGGYALIVTSNRPDIRPAFRETVLPSLSGGDLGFSNEGKLPAMLKESHVACHKHIQ